MNLRLVKPEPCGSCERCTFAAEVVKMLEFVDGRYLLHMQAAAREVTEAKWWRSEGSYKAALRRLNELREEWYRERTKILNPSVLDSMICARTFAVILFKTPDAPEPQEVTARPREVPLLGTPAHPERCLRCGTSIGLLFQLEVCRNCFGKEGP